MPRSVPTVLLAVLATAALVWWLFGADDAAARAVDRASAAPEVAPPPVSIDEVAVAPTPPRADARALLAAAPDSAGPPAIATAASATLRWRVVFADDAPAAGAVVEVTALATGVAGWITGSFDEAELASARLPPGPWSGAFRQEPSPTGERPRVFTADAAGFVDLPVPAGVDRWRASAERDGRMDAIQRRVGAGHVDDGFERVLRLERVHRVAQRVRVVDAAGAPVPDIAVALVSTSSPSVLAHAYTDRDGRARFEQDLPLDAEAVVEAFVLVEPRPRARLDPEHEVELRLEPTGSVRVRAAQSAVPTAAPVVVVLQPGGRFGDALQSVLRGREAHFAHVGLGQTLSAGPIRTDDGGEWTGDIDFAGPVTAGEEIVVELGAAMLSTMVIRVVDERGVALADRAIAVETASKHLVGSWYVRTDARGQMALERTKDSGQWLRVSLSARAEEQVDGLPRRLHGEIAASTLAGAPEGEVHDAGDVVLRLLPILAEGRVVDGTGTPVRGVRVELATLDGRARRPERDALALSDERGRFLLQGEAPAGANALWASGEGWLEAGPRPIALGERGVELVVEPAAALVLPVRLDGTTRADGLRFELVLAGGRSFALGPQQAGSRQRPADHVAYEVLYVAMAVPAGAATLVGHDATRGEDVAHVALALQMGELRRLDVLDLTRPEELFRLTVLGAQRQPMEHYAVQYTSGGVQVETLSVLRGTSTLRRPTAQEELRVLAPAHREAEVRDVDDEVEVVLELGARVVLVLAPGLTPPDTTVSHTALLVQRIGGDPASSVGGQLRPDGRADVPLGEPGRYRARWHAFGPRAPKDPPPMAEFEVTDAHLGTGVPIELRFDPHEWERFVAALAGR